MEMKTLRLVALLLLLPFVARADNLDFKLPAVNIPITIKDQTVNITASGQLTQLRSGHDEHLFHLQLRADLAELQQNMAALLSSVLDKDNPCGDRIAIQSATLVPAAPAAIATVNLHYERWVCARIFGKQQVKRLVGGNATLPMTLTPTVDPTGTQFQLVPELGPIQADGSLGDVLRAGGVAEKVRDKLQEALQNAMQKAANLTATLPPVAQPYLVRSPS